MRQLGSTGVHKLKRTKLIAAANKLNGEADEGAADGTTADDGSSRRAKDDDAAQPTDKGGGSREDVAQVDDVAVGVPGAVRRRGFSRWRRRIVFFGRFDICGRRAEWAGPAAGRVCPSALRTHEPYVE